MNKQEYLLTCLSEEAAEIIQAVGKAQRFGLDDDYNDESPRQVIEREFLDLVAVMDMILENDHVEDLIQYSAEEIRAKQIKVKEFMKYSKDKGIL